MDKGLIVRIIMELELLVNENIVDISKWNSTCAIALPNNSGTVSRLYSVPSALVFTQIIKSTNNNNNESMNE